MPLQVVTVGDAASRRFDELQAAGEYSEAYFMHGLAVEAAEAVAEDLGLRERTGRVPVREQERPSAEAGQRHGLAAVGRNERRGACESEAGRRMLDRRVGRPRAWRGQWDDELRDQLLLPERGREGAEDELPRAERSLTVGRAQAQLCSEGENDRGHVGSRVGVGEASAERSSVSHLEVADSGGALGDRSQRRPSQLRCAREVVPGRERAESKLAVAGLDSPKLEAPDIHEKRRTRDRELHDR